MTENCIESSGLPTKSYLFCYQLLGHSTLRFSVSSLCYTSSYSVELRCTSVKLIKKQITATQQQPDPMTGSDHARKESVDGLSCSSEGSAVLQEIRPSESTKNTASATYEITPYLMSIQTDLKATAVAVRTKIGEVFGEVVTVGRHHSLKGSFDGKATRTPTASSTTALLPGEAELEMLMNVAEYEIHQDPYRGIMSQQQSLETQTSITTPWNACEWGTLPPEPIQDVGVELLDPQIVVRHVGNCACPSMKEWTRNMLVERTKKANSNKKKRKQNSKSNEDDEQSFHVGVRPKGDTYVCPCDYNPLCLASLGGIVNDVIEERCRALDAALQSQKPAPSPSLLKKKSPLDDKSMDAEFEVLVVPHSEKQKESSFKSKELVVVDEDKVKRTHGRQLRDPVLDDSSADTFTFTGESSSNRTDVKLTLNTPLLQPHVAPLSGGNPEDVFSLTTLPQQDLSCIEFSPKTNDELLRVRSSIVVETAPIRSYIHRILKIHPCSDDKDCLTIDKYIKILKDWHAGLQFQNPIADGREISGDRISLSMPPGIQNLGATCYLNTQLQCLAQNPTFLGGIFSWHMVDVNHAMNSVMEKLQILLASMFLGGECTLSTREFSNALGLQHHEQQDPNEFARLLFDRMEESFQQCDNDGDLSNLLNRIFHGVTTYETICMTCDKASERSEGFMDLNLPIVKRPKEPKKMVGTIAAAFGLSNAKNVDTDVQYCLDQYTCAEMLDGENQYFCDVCNAKRNAKRVLKLTELPPVLNVQLSRYVYDRAKGEKKKVSDKVLLPTSLTVETGGETKKKYLLCAVMKHQGTSAYSGHYLAEVMDWLTGTWFEFNDEIVKLLPDGPSSSFDPEMVKETNIGGDPKNTNQANPTKSDLSGSQDAYNMYYVEESYLSKAAKQAILVQEKLTTTGPNAGEALDDVTDQRKATFKDLTEMCIEDAYISERLNRRKTGIRKYMLPNADALVPNKATLVGEIGAWVPTDFLRRYLLCRPDAEVDSLIGGIDPVFDYSSFLCEHKYLSPETASTGKLLPIALYNGLVLLIAGERAFLCKEPVDERKLAEIGVCKITPTNNLICQECSKSYRDQLSAKLNILRLAKELHDALDTKTPDAAVDFKKGEEPKLDKEMYVYVLSRQSATKFRRQVAAIFRSVANCERGGILHDTLFTNQVPIYRGLGAIDISSITQYSPTENGTIKSPTTKAPNSDELDKYFNTNITCSHGNCNFMYNGRQVRYVGEPVWNLLRKLFPDAIEHRRRRELDNGKKVDELNDQDCYTCRAEKDSMESLKDAIQNWASKTREANDLKNLLNSKRTISWEQDILNFSVSTDGCRLVHKSDITTWREAVKLFSNAQKIKGDSCSELRSFAGSIAFPSSHAVVLEFENEPVDQFVASIRSFICREHHKVVKNAILEDAASSDENELRKVADYIVVVGSDEYDAYIASLASLLLILRGDGNSMRSIIAIEEDNFFIKHVREVASSHHPLIRYHRENETYGDIKNTVMFTHYGSAKKFALFPGFCDHESCMKECAPPQDAEKDKDVERCESISVDSLDAKPSVKKSKKNFGSGALGSGAFDPILLESDIEDDNDFSFRVFEFEAGATAEQALVSLQDISAIHYDFEASNELRRSSRKRKNNYPCGVLLSENSVSIGLHYNFAAICLRMYESCGIPADYSKLFLVLTPQFETTLIGETSPRGIESELTLEEKIHRMRNGRPNDAHFNPTKHTLLLYQKAPNISGEKSNETDLIESMIQFTNYGSKSVIKSVPSPNNGSSSLPRKKKSRPSERGFQGTLLQSGAPPALAPSNGDDDSVIQGQPEASTISDEEKKRPRPYMVVDDLSPRSSGHSSMNNNRMVLSDDEDDSEDEALLNRPLTFSKKSSRDPGLKSSGTTTTIVDTSIIDRDEADREKLCQQVFAMLENSQDSATANPSRMWDAIHFAFSEFPDVNSADSLFGSAMVRYLNCDDKDETNGYGSCD